MLRIPVSLPNDQLFMTLSTAIVQGSTSARSMVLSGYIQNVPLKVLVDSGSSYSFLSMTIAQQLSGVSELSANLKVQVANGNVLQCTSHLPQAEWSVCGVTFHSDLKVLPLSSYDMILGMDWLESHSPMKVHWQQKWMIIPYQDSSVLLYTSLADLPVGSLLQVFSLDLVIAQDSSVSLPVEVQSLIEEFAILFEVPKSLPPQRSCDHSISLVDGAAPITMRPYRYAPVLKDEIENQIKEMLTNGLIQPSNSPFSSSVLLVKKKDNTWRFCVDYRFLNAITDSHYR